MKEGLSPLNFREIFKIPPGFNGDLNDKLPVPFYRLEISRTKFSTRARKYWNFLPKEIKELNYYQFKREAKTYVLANAEWFLNFGNRNRAGAIDLPKIKHFFPKKLVKKEPIGLCDKPAQKRKKKLKN